MDVVFSAPFSGAIYKWFEERLRAEGKLEGIPYEQLDSSYYRHSLRGAIESRPQTLASVVMLDEIYLAAGDLAAPDAMRRGVPARLPGKRFGASLGVTVGPNLIHDASRWIGQPEDVEALATEPEVAQALRGLPVDETWSEIVAAVADTMVAGSLRRPLVCGPRRREVINALIQVGVITQAIIFADASPMAGVREESPIERGGRIHNVVAGYQQLAGLEFDAPTLDILARVKDDSRVRESAEAFQLILAGKGSDDTRAELEAGLRSALTTRKLRDSTARVVDLTAISLSVASLFPGPGTAAGVASLAIPAAATAMSPVASTASWFDIGPRMQYAAMVAQLEQRVRHRDV